MARYTVPQDVEAEDKLIGPFSFRQFVYLIIAAIGIGGCWALFSVFPPLAIIPLPIVILFGILALPLKKRAAYGGLPWGYYSVLSKTT